MRARLRDPVQLSLRDRTPGAPDTCFPLNVPKDTMGLAIDMRGFFRIQPEIAVHTARPTFAAPSMRVAASAHSCLREIVETAIGIASDTDAKRRHASISRYL